MIFRLFIAVYIRALETQLGARLLASLNIRPSRTLALNFIALIGVGTVLLTFPAATADGKGAHLIDALFTMTSASCVAGLSLFDTGVHFTRFGRSGNSIWYAGRWPWHNGVVCRLCGLGRWHYSIKAAGGFSGSFGYIYPRGT